MKKNDESIFSDNSYLLEMISDLPMVLQNNNEKRLVIAEDILKKIIFNKYKSNNNIKLSDSKIILFEVMRLGLDGNGLTESKKHLLQLVGIEYGVDGETFNELLSQALSLHKEMRKAFNLVLE